MSKTERLLWLTYWEGGKAGEVDRDRNDKGSQTKVFPLAVGDLLIGSPAPLYRIKQVSALNREAACWQAGYRHDADGPTVVRPQQVN